MLQKECCEAANVRVVKRALFITRNSLKSHEERNLLSPVSNTRAITPIRTRGSSKIPGYESKLRATPSSIAHAAPSDVSLPAVFVLWRFADAGPGVRGVIFVGPASENLHKLRRSQYEHMFSALPPNSDIARCSRHVANVPIVLQ